MFEITESEEAKIAECSDILQEVISSTFQSNFNENKNKNSTPVTFSSNHNKLAEGEIQIPLSYIVQAKPLIDFLV